MKLAFAALAITGCWRATPEPVIASHAAPAAGPPYAELFTRNASWTLRCTSERRFTPRGEDRETKVERQDALVCRTADIRRFGSTTLARLDCSGDSGPSGWYAMAPNGFHALKHLPERGLDNPPHPSAWDHWPEAGTFDQYDVAVLEEMDPLIEPKPVAKSWDAVSDFNGAHMVFALTAHYDTWCVERIFSNGGAPDRATVCVRAGRGLVGTWFGSAGPDMVGTRCGDDAPSY
jgi:hypothetical protein